MVHVWTFFRKGEWGCWIPNFLRNFYAIVWSFFRKGGGGEGLGILNHIPESNKQKKSAAGLEPSPTVGRQIVKLKLPHAKSGAKKQWSFQTNESGHVEQGIVAPHR